METWEHPRRHGAARRSSKEGEVEPPDDDLTGHVVEVSDSGVTIVCTGCRLERTYNWTRCDTAAEDRAEERPSTVRLPQCGLCGHVIFLNVSDEVYVEDSNDYWTQYATTQLVAPKLVEGGAAGFSTAPSSQLPMPPPEGPAPA